MTFRVTRQTVYWLVLSLVIILFTLWLTRLQADIQDLYDQIDANTAEMSTL
jgi:cell division protein FtsL